MISWEKSYLESKQWNANQLSGERESLVNSWISKITAHVPVSLSYSPTHQWHLILSHVLLGRLQSQGDRHGSMFTSVELVPRFVGAAGG